MHACTWVYMFFGSTKILNCRKFVVGYTPLPWSCDGCYHTADGSIIFSFDQTEPDNIKNFRAITGHSEHVWWYFEPLAVLIHPTIDVKIKIHRLC